MDWRAHRYAPALGTRLCRVGSIPLGACKELRYGQGEGFFSLLLYREEDCVKAYVNRCPHFSLPLNSKPDCFLILAHARIMCAFHCAIFRLKDGHCIAGPAEGMSLESVPVVLLDDVVVLGES